MRARTRLWLEMDGASTTSGSQPLPRPGDVVYLLTEVDAGGRIHEIGARALVVHAGEGGLVVDLGTPAQNETASCATGHVRRGARQRARAVRYRRV